MEYNQNSTMNDAKSSSGERFKEWWYAWDQRKQGHELAKAAWQAQEKYWSKKLQSWHNWENGKDIETKLAELTAERNSLRDQLNQLQEVATEMLETIEALTEGNIHTMDLNARISKYSSLISEQKGEK